MKYITKPRSIDWNIDLNAVALAKAKKNKEESTRDNPIIVNVNEKCLCIICGGEMKYYDRVIRPVTEADESKTYYSICRYRCDNCSKIHRVLPSFMMPYKRYRLEVIQEAIECTRYDPLFERWRSWYRRIKSYFIACLNSISLSTGFCAKDLIAIVKKEQFGIGECNGDWLANLVRIITNAQMWIPTATA